VTDGARFTRTREDFACGHCGAAVRGNGYTNHCPKCLWSRHVDVAPGDRAADCGGLMRPVGVLFEDGEHVVVQRCESCGHQRRNRAARNDSRAALAALFGAAVPDPPAPARRSARRR
jgi:hypothetical protein